MEDTRNMKNMSVVSSTQHASIKDFDGSIPFLEESLVCSTILCNSHIDEDEDGEDDNNTSRFTRVWNLCVKASIVFSIVGIILVFVIDYSTNRYIEMVYSIFLGWLEQNPVVGVVYLTLLYFFATALFVPAAMLTFGVGFLLADAFGLGIGIAVGTACIFIASFMEAVVSFLLGRYVLNGWVEGLSRNSVFFEAMVYAMDRKGLCILTLLRMIPFLPMNCVNYVAGTTRISFLTFACGSVLILPSILIYIFLGASGSALEANISDSVEGHGGAHSTVSIIFWSLAMVSTLIAIALIRHYVTKELKYILVLRRAEIEQLEAFT